jgi:hypothetical protein
VSGRAIQMRVGCHVGVVIGSVVGTTLVRARASAAVCGASQIWRHLHRSSCTRAVRRDVPH